MSFSRTYKKIICLTEESVETLFEIGKGDLIVGVSSFVKRPDEATKLPKVSFFTSSNLDKICKLNPDLILGYSDIQKDIAKDLIERGQNVFVSNHRSIDDILQYISSLSLMVDAKDEGELLLNRLLEKIEKAKKFASGLKRKPKVYFEEWDSPQISAIKWVSELIELCGGIEIFKEKSSGILAKERIVDNSKVAASNPDIIFGCWCGKKVKIDSILQRDELSGVAAIKNKHIFELEPEIFLQPGPAPLLSGIDILIDYFEKWSQEEL